MSDRILIGTRKGLFTLARGRDALWGVERVEFLGIPVTLAIADAERGGAFFSAVKHGHFGAKLHRSTDHGATWEERGVPVYPKDDEGKSLEQIWALASAGGTLWAGTIPGGLFRSTDDGTNWGLVRALWDREERKKWLGGGYDDPGIHSICIHPDDPRRLWVGVSCGGVWLTTDGGATWEMRAKGMRAEYVPPEQAYDQVTQDPHHVVMCRAKPDVLWAQHHNGIFRSTDGGANWSELQARPSVFGFACAVHPRDPDTAWFVPAQKDEVRIPVEGRVVVNRTRDGGRTFETISAGLPQSHAYDLVYRHGLDIDGTGERLVMGSTTGGVWTSDDQGSTWNALDARLPPIYSVCFA